LLDADADLAANSTDAASGAICVVDAVANVLLQALEMTTTKPKQSTSDRLLALYAWY
jgi:hypothetical protein